MSWAQWNESTLSTHHPHHGGHAQTADRGAGHSSVLLLAPAHMDCAAYIDCAASVLCPCGCSAVQDARGCPADNESEAASLSCLTLQETRESLGLSLAGAVVVVDEAHNLVEAVSSAHSATLQLTQVQQAHAQLSGYLERFRTRLAPGGLLSRETSC